MTDVIVMYFDPIDSRSLDSVTEKGGLVSQDLPVINGLSIRISAAEAQSMALDESVEYVAMNAEIGGMLEIARPTISAEKTTGHSGGNLDFTGAGVTVAVIDSGVAPHRDLGDRLVASYDARDGVVSTAHSDPMGHGTHVAGIIAGDGSGSRGAYRGIAPDAKIISLRVLDEQGMGETADAIAALEWVIQNRQRYDIRIVNMSLGHPIFEPAAKDPLVRVVERAIRVGLVVVCSAGNYGTYGHGGFFSITSPGNAENAITVASRTDWNTYAGNDDMISSYSSRGPTLVDHLMKPDLNATGNRIVSLRSPGSMLDTEYPENRREGKRNRFDYYEMSGTSMAAPMVAGAAALMLEKDAGLNSATVKARLMITADKSIDDNPLARGAGTIQVSAALNETTWATRAPTPKLYLEDGCCNMVLRDDIARLWGDELWDSSALWSDAAIWGDSVMWADSALWADSVMWADSVLWDDGYLGGDSVMWSDSVMWADMIPQPD